MISSLCMAPVLPPFERVVSLRPREKAVLKTGICRASVEDITFCGQLPPLHRVRSVFVIKEEEEEKEEESRKKKKEEEEKKHEKKSKIRRRRRR